jgi:hypothetical protein
MREIRYDGSAMSAPNLEPPLSQWWKRFARLQVLAEIESATGKALDANDPLPDSLIASAQALGLLPVDLRLFIYEDPAREDWSHDALARWAQARAHKV